MATYVYVVIDNYMAGLGDWPQDYILGVYATLSEAEKAKNIVCADIICSDPDVTLSELDEAIVIVGKALGEEPE